MTTGSVEIDGTRITYEVVGDGPALVLLHAGIADRRMWDDQVTPFSTMRRVIRYDLRGFGDSPLGTESFAHQDDLAGLLRHLSVDSATILGCSFGGRVAIDFALTYPEMVESLILVAPALGGYAMSESLDAFEDQIADAFFAGDFARAAEVDLRVWVDGPHRTPEQVDPAVRQRAALMAEHVYVVAIDGGRPRPLDPPAIKRLEEIRVPTFVIVGEFDQPDMLAIADLLKTRLPNAQKVVMHGVAHLPNLEQPEAFNRLVSPLL